MGSYSQDSGCDGDLVSIGLIEDLWHISRENPHAVADAVPALAWATLGYAVLTLMVGVGSLPADRIVRGTGRQGPSVPVGLLGLSILGLDLHQADVASRRWLQTDLEFPDGAQ